MNIQKTYEDFKNNDNGNTRKALKKSISTAMHNNSDLDEAIIEDLFLAAGFIESNIKGIYSSWQHFHIHFFEPTLLEKAQIVCKGLTNNKYQVDKIIEKKSTKALNFKSGSEVDKDLDHSLVLDKYRVLDNDGSVFNISIIANYANARDLVITELQP